MAAALSRVYAGLCRRDRLTSKECPFWFYSLFCGPGENQNEKWFDWPHENNAEIEHELVLINMADYRST
jgi:hypothetical protein